MQTGTGALDRFIHEANLALFKRRLADPSMTEAERRVIQELLAREEARFPQAGIKRLCAQDANEYLPSLRENSRGLTVAIPSSESRAT